MRSVVLVGAGAIGSFLVPLLARIELGHVRIMDHDRYEEANRAGQDIPVDAVGLDKAEYQAARLRVLRPDIVVDARVEPVEATPLGLLRADVVLAAVDGRGVRQWLGTAVTRLGGTLIDAAVDAPHGLVRVDVLRPGPAAACPVCEWSPSDHGAVEQTHSCLGAAVDRPATAAPAWLGALAAAWQAAELARLLTGGEPAVTGTRTVLDGASPALRVTTLRRNPACRFDHASWAIERLDAGPAEVTLADALALAAPGSAGRLRVAGHLWVCAMTCTECGGRRPLLRLSRRLSAAQRSCPACGGPATYTGFGVRDDIGADAAIAGRPAASMTLDALGLLPGDVITLDDARHFELGGAR